MPFQKMRNHLDRNAYNAMCGKFYLKAGRVRMGFKSWDVADCSVELVDNGTLSNQGASNVIRSGGLPTINTTGWLIVITPDGEQRSRLIGDEITRARTFVMNFNLERQRATEK